MIDAILLALTATIAGGPDTAAPPPAPSATAASAPAPSQRYCVVTDLTGSRLAHRECRTRADWLKRGFDPLAK